MRDTVRLVDAAIWQAQEPVECARCSKPLTGQEAILYFCSWPCQRAWWERTQGRLTALSGVSATYPWADERACEPDVRYPVADNGWLRDFGEKQTTPRNLTDQDWRDSLRLWVDDPCFCESCLYSMAVMMDALNHRLPSYPEDIADGVGGKATLKRLALAALTDTRRPVSVSF